MTSRPTSLSGSTIHPRKCYAPPTACKTLKEENELDRVLGAPARRPKRIKKKLVAAARPALEKLGLI